jgi:hypothetical protein
MTQMSDVKAAMRLAFNRCPRCGEKSLTYGHWLRWCQRRGCRWIGAQRREHRERV